MVPICGVEFGRDGESAAPAMASGCRVAPGTSCDELFEMLPRGRIGIVVHATAEGHEARTAAHEYAVVRRQPVEVHEVAAVLDAFAPCPADRGALLWGQRLRDDDEGEGRHLLGAHAGHQMRVAVGGEDDLVGGDDAAACRQPELAALAPHSSTRVSS